MSRLRYLNPLPDPDAGKEFASTLQEACSDFPNVSKQPPRQIAVVGLPGSGDSIVHRYLKANLDLPVVHGPPGMWQHQTPFHPSVQTLLSKTCSERKGNWTGFVFVVRHPLTWMVHKEGGAPSGKCIVNRSGNQLCSYGPCERGQCHSSYQHELPRKYIVHGSMLPVWFSYVAHLPDIPPVMVVQWEDILMKPKTVRKQISEHFGVHHKAGPSLLPHAKLLEERKSWKDFKHFWLTFGFSAHGQGQGNPAGPGSQFDPSICSMENSPIYIPSLEEVATAVESEKELLSAVRKKYQYRMPPAEVVKIVTKTCGKKMEHSGGASTKGHRLARRLPPGSAGGLQPRRPSFLDRFAEAIPLPSFDDSKAFHQSLKAECDRVPHGARPPPAQLAIAGMPNTGMTGVPNTCAFLHVSVCLPPAESKTTPLLTLRRYKCPHQVPCGKP